MGAFAPLTLLLVAIAAPALGAGGSIGDCLRQARRDEVFNENAKVSATAYAQTNARTLYDVVGHFGDDFAADLGPGSTVIDAGGGFSVYGVELAGRGVDVVSINTQDFYGELVSPLTYADFLTAVHAAKAEDSLPATIGNANLNTLIRISYALGIGVPHAMDPIGSSLYRWKLKPGGIADEMTRELLAWKESLTRKLESEPFRTRFQRRIGMVQDVLPRMEAGSAERVIDLYGAYFYSSDRLNLLDSYYASLKPGGRAYIHVEGLRDFVRGKETNVHLVDYLVATYPEIFAYEMLSARGIRVKALVIRKPDPSPPLNLSKQFSTFTGVGTRNSNGFVVPENEYTPLDH